MGKGKKGKGKKFVKLEEFQSRGESEKPDNKRPNHIKNNTNDDSTSTEEIQPRGESEKSGNKRPNRIKNNTNDSSSREEFPPMTPRTVAFQSSADILSISSTTNQNENENTLDEISSGTDKQNNLDYDKSEPQNSSSCRESEPIYQNVSLNSQSSESFQTDQRPANYDPKNYSKDANSVKGKGAAGRAGGKLQGHHDDRSNSNPNAQNKLKNNKFSDDGRNSQKFNKSTPRVESAYIHSTEAQIPPDNTQTDFTDINKGNSGEENQSWDNPKWDVEHSMNNQLQISTNNVWQEKKSNSGK